MKPHMMGVNTIEAAIFGADGAEMRQTLRTDRDAGFGLLERRGDRWTLLIPHGASARVEGVPVDLRTLTLEPSGERRMPYVGRRAQVVMADFRFEVSRFEISASAR